MQIRNTKTPAVNLVQMTVQMILVRFKGKDETQHIHLS